MRIGSAVTTTSETFRENSAAMEVALAEVQEAIAASRAGGGEAAAERHLKRGKLLPRDRVGRLLDPGTPFLEIGVTAAHGLYDGDAPGAGMIAGVGRVSGREVMVLCNCLLYTSPSPRDQRGSRMPSSA